MSNQEMLLALADELQQGEELLKPSVSLLSDTLLPAEIIAAAKEDYCAFTTRVAGVADAINLTSLQTLMSFIDTNVSIFSESDASTRSNQAALTLIQDWPSLLSDFLRNAGNPQAAENLSQFLLANDWPWKVDAQQLKQIIQDISEYAKSHSESNADANDEIEQLCQADVSTQIPNDISPKLLITFQEELPQSTAELSKYIQKLSDSSATLEDLTEARRVAHTLKGAANIVGVPGIANFTHHLEDILEFLVEQGGLPSDNLATDLTESADCLEIMTEAALGLSEPPEEALQTLKNLAGWKQRFSTDVALPIKSKLAPKTDPGEETKTLTETEATQLKHAIENNQSADKPKSSSPEPVSSPSTISGNQLLDRLLDITGELSSSNLQTQGQLEHAIKNIESINLFHHTLHTQMNTLQDLIFTQGLKKPQQSSDKKNTPNDHFDPLELDEYNELHSTANLLSELVDDVSDLGKNLSSQLKEIKELSNLQDQLHKELDQSITSERLISIKTILPRLQRSVRQTCKMTNKQVELIVSGESLKVDNSILDKIIDPLLHILRNAVDHGVETIAERIGKGKPETANVSLTFERQGNNIIITCEDDGCGIDAAAVKDKAIALNLLTPEQIINETDLFELILQPGFSTKSKADQISGRGVGMDVVAKNISDLRGHLSIHSEQGSGTKFTVTVPQTLLKTHVLLLRSQDLIFGVLSSSFDQIIDIGADFCIEADGKSRIEFNNKTYEIKHLNQLLGLYTKTGISHKKHNIAMLVDDANVRTATLIDQAIGNGELVVKKVGTYLPNMPGIVGTVLTAEGTAAPVFDLKELLRRPSKLASDFLSKHIDQSLTTAVNILIVDDSSSARRSLSQVVKDIGYEVRTAIDGVEAITLIEESRPDLILTDLEMPKMNGLELAAHLRSNNETKNLPIVMVTSRSTEKHRTQAMSTGIDCYITKPFNNDDLIHEMHQLLAK